MNMVKMEIGDKVLCMQGDDECVLAPTHTYEIVGTQRQYGGAKVQEEFRVANVLGEVQPGWFPAQSFEPYNDAR